MPKLVRTRLSVMMFLFFFAPGAWIVTLTSYLSAAPTAGGLCFTPAEVGWVYSTFAFGGMLAPLVVGLLADRLFRAEVVLGASGLVSGALLAAAAWWCQQSGPRVAAAYLAAGLNPDDPGVRSAAAEAFGPLFAVMLGSCFAMQVGLTLTYVIAFRHLPDARRSFARVRLFGTLGWIAAGLTLSQFFDVLSPGPLYLAAATAAACGAFAFTLPPTPPRGTATTLGAALGLPALGLFRDRSFGVFVGVGCLATGMNQFYVLGAHPYLTDLGVRDAAGVMTLGQVCEVGCMLLLPAVDPRRSLKPLMTLGLAGWVLRSAVLLSGDPTAAVAVGVPMHGWSFTFFFVVAAGYLDREAPPHLRAAAQGIVTFVSNGLGVWAGNLFAGWVIARHKVGAAVDWPDVWVVPLVGCSAALVVFVLFFRPPPENSAPSARANPEHP